MEEWAEGGEWAGHCGIGMMETREGKGNFGSGCDRRDLFNPPIYDITLVGR